MDADYTADDIMCVCISRVVEDGELLVQGIATPLVAAGYLLAKRTHAPHVVFASAVGTALCTESGTLSLTRMEDFWLGHAQSQHGFGEIAGELLPALTPKEFFRPAQIDQWGNSNNVVIGEHAHPRLRLPGCGGTADVTVASPSIYLYVPRHSRAVFVEKIDFVSGLGAPSPERPGKRPGPRLLVSDLGVFDYVGGTMRLCSYHPGNSVEHIARQTGFPLPVAPDVHETQPPTAEELRLLREEIDPLSIRTLERLSSSRRRRLLRELIQVEQPAAFAYRTVGAR